MTPETFKALRKECGLSQTAWGRALGYSGSNATVQVAIARFENGTRPVPAQTALLAGMLAEKG